MANETMIFYPISKQDTVFVNTEEDVENTTEASVEETTNNDKQFER